MSKFTPGPWEIKEARNKDTLLEVYVRRAGGDTDIAVDIFDPVEMQPSVANARLIAAAPELYDLLAECAEYMDYIPESAAGGDDVARAIVQRAKKILAKVEAE